MNKILLLLIIPILVFIFGLMLTTTNRFNPGNCIVSKTSEKWQFELETKLVKRVGKNHYLLETLSKERQWDLRGNPIISIEQLTELIKNIDQTHIIIECPNWFKL